MTVEVLGATPLLREAVALLIQTKFGADIASPGDFLVVLDGPVPPGAQGISLAEVPAEMHLVALSDALLPRAVREASVDAGSLTRREHEIALMIAAGLENDEIAARLGIRPQSVRNVVHVILQKLGCQNRIQIALHMKRQGVAR